MKITKNDVGKKVWDFMLGWGTITEFNINWQSPAFVEFPHVGVSYHADGKMYYGENQRLFWDEIKFEEPPKPKRKVKKTIERWMNIYPDGEHAHRTEEDATLWANAPSPRLACVKLVGEYEVEEE
jgi:hypothetical protein